MNGNVKAAIGVIIAIITIAGFVMAVNGSSYGELDTKFDDHLEDEFQKGLREEHRLTAIEEQLKTTNRLLEDIRTELRNR